VFSTHIEANGVEKGADAFAAARLTDDDRAAILRLAADPNIGAGGLVAVVVLALQGARLLRVSAAVFGLSTKGRFVLHTPNQPHQRPTKPRPNQTT
jgi:cobalamin synthase